MPAQLRPELLPKVVERLRALADESRIRILMRLRDGAANVTALTEELELGQASVSKHLALLRQVGLVEVTRQANQAIYRIRDDSVFEMCDIVCGGVVRHLEEEHAILTGRPPPASRPKKVRPPASKKRSS